MASRYWVGGSGTWNGTNTANWSASIGGAGGASVPTSADAVFFNSSSGGGVVTLGQDVNCLTCSLLGYTGTIDWANYKIKIAGNAATVFRNDAGVTVTGNPTVECTYAGSTGTRTLTMLATSEANSINVLISAGSDTVTHTTSNFKNLDFTGFSGSFTSLGRTIFGNLTLSPTMTLVAGTQTTTFGATSGTKTITTNGITIDNFLAFNGIGGTWEFQDALTQGATRGFTITNGTVKLKNGVTNTVGAFATSGTNQKFLQSTVAGSQATLSQASGTVSASYLTIQDINATGGAVWEAFTTNNNVDAGNNSGWDFSSQLGRYIYTRRKNKRILP
jgi:hypothetical protein